MLPLWIILAVSSILANAADEASPKNWWDTTVFYQIYPRSFKDSDGDGLGDLNGITSKLEHLVDAGIGALWVSPIYPSPMVDFGYDISDFKAIDPIFGSMADFERLVSRAKELGLKVIIDFVPNHSSDKHEWFQKSVQGEQPYADYYVWEDGKIVNGTRSPPNNWLSVFGGSAWEWNENRKQFYLHQFATAQPDLNFRNARLRQEMEDCLTFWLDKGIDGVRIDSMNFMVECENLEDEPLSGAPGVPADDHDYLKHICTMNLNEDYLILQTWRKLLDDYSERTRSSPKVIMTEAYADVPLTMKYYQYGSNVPFNFMFITDLDRSSGAADFKRVIDTWMTNMPVNQSANWVLSNHDNPRVGSRFGTRKIDQMTMLATVLPGMGAFYNGDEIGMVDTWISWKDTVDPEACNTNAERYESKTRDPERTPFQWDNSTSAGFSSSSRTWLPVNSNYKTLNLATEKAASNSHFRVFQNMTWLRKSPVLQDGSLGVVVVDDEVLVVVRELGEASPVVLVINFDNSTRVVDVEGVVNLPQEMTVYTASVESGLEIGSSVNTSELSLPAEASVVLTSHQTYQSFNSV